MEKIIRASRLYRTALELIESRPDITYQLLISAVETMAALRGYEADEADKIRAKRSVFDKAREFGLDEERAKALALEACQGIPWTREKFKRFILDHVSPADVSGEDPVFPRLFLRPAPAHFESVLGPIYRTRSGNLHGGDPFPPWVGQGTSPTVDPRSVPLTGLSPDDVPPVPWLSVRRRCA